MAEWSMISRRAPVVQTAALWLFIVALAVPFVSVVGGVLFLAIARRSHRS